ncbi:hypothetical protein GIB67_019689 [Kingdonia uniflora]|uniref:Helicase ATP-binding domain-containing protein n=1 Tax=Kingdonia uniflora TaxID=39325 RepID=A0A7J7MJU8_9MAGN|nr:hypothetical protein GIB67_019689 [Kingdonia uniflora]
MEESQVLGKQKAQEDLEICVDEVVVPSGYASCKDESVHGTLSNPIYNGTEANSYPFNLDPFQQVSVACLKKNESALVSAHTSAGKTVVAEYAIAMAFRDKRHMTGDVTISPNASCLVMTTEILLGMLYRGSEMLKEVAWVVFDEIHYMKDHERGVVCEESIIFLPSVIKMVFLSATMSNGTEFAEWIYGLGLYLVVDENEQFKEDCFVKLQDTFAKQKKQGDGNKSRNANSSGRIAKNGTSIGGSDIYKIVKKFTMGLNMPVKTVVFISVRKWDGDSHRIIGSSEYIQALPDIGERVSKLDKEAAMLDASGEGELAEYHKLILDIAQLEKKMMSEIIRPERVLYFLLPGRLGNLPSVLSAQSGSAYILDTLLHCTPGSRENGSRPRPSPPSSREKGEMHVVLIQLPLITILSKIRINVPSDLCPMKAKHSVLLAVQELATHFLQGFPKLNPVKEYITFPSKSNDKGIEDPEFVQLVNQIEELEKKLFDHPLQKSSQDTQQIKCFQRKAVVNHEIPQLKLKMSESQGRAACLIDTRDELLITELMFNGTFNDLDHHQVATLSSCFIPREKSNEQIHLRTELGEPLQQLQESARRIAEIQRECKLEVNVEEYVESTVRIFFMDVIYCWSKGATFAEVIEMTDIFEGSIIRLSRRLDEFLNQL